MAPEKALADALYWLDAEKQGLTQLTPRARAECHRIIRAHKYTMSTQTTEEKPTTTNGQTAIQSARPGEPSQIELIQKIPLDRVHISAVNTRHPKPAEVAELTQSIKTFGQTTPAIARPHPKKSGHFELAAGARRRVAAEAAGLATLDVIVRQLNDNDLEETILIENLQREDPDPKAEVKLLDRLVKRGIQTAEQISAHLGKPKHWAVRRLQLLKVIPELRNQWENDDDTGHSLGIGHYTADMMALLGSLAPDTQKLLVAKQQYGGFVNYDLRDIESRPALEKYITKAIMCRLADAPFDLKDKRFFVKGCGPGCASDSSKQAGLFDTINDKDARCLNCACFQSRLALFRKAQFDEMTKELKKDEKGKLRFVYSREEGMDPRRPSKIQLGNNVAEVTEKQWGEKIGQADDKGAERVVLVTGDGKMRLGYLKKERMTYSGQPVKSKKKSLDTRKKILQSRRWDIVRKSLIDLVLASSVKQVSVDVVDLVPIFGFSFNAEPHRGEKYSNKLWEMFDARKKKGYEMPANQEKINYAICGSYMHRARTSYSHRGAVTIKDRDEAIWHGLKHVIIDQLLHFRLSSEIISDHGVTDIERVGKLMKFDTAKAKKEADLIIPPPKTWGKVDVHTLEPLK
jgi:ParB/RepB/Spo0J family partition protein